MQPMASGPLPACPAERSFISCLGLLFCCSSRSVQMTLRFCYSSKFRWSRRHVEPNSFLHAKALYPCETVPPPGSGDWVQVHLQAQAVEQGEHTELSRTQGRSASDIRCQAVLDVSGCDTKGSRQTKRTDLPGSRDSLWNGPSESLSWPKCFFAWRQMFQLVFTGLTETQSHVLFC